MNFAKALVLGSCLGIGSAALATAPASTQTEIDHLLEYIEQSDCAFYRNGNRYDAERAREHIENKYAYLEKRGLAESTERFIERAASESSFTGRAYQVRCADQPKQPSRKWLTQELERFRAQADQG